MPFTVRTDVTCYCLQEDGAIANREFLSYLHNPGETWIIAFGTTIVPIIIELVAAHKNGVPIHLYLDHSQAFGRADKHQVQRLVNAGMEVTIGTSLVSGRHLSHTKGAVVNGTPPWCWEGSINVLESGWHAVDTAMVFFSKEWHERFVLQFKELRKFAWESQEWLQVMKAPRSDFFL